MTLWCVSEYGGLIVQSSLHMMDVSCMEYCGKIKKLDYGGSISRINCVYVHEFKCTSVALMVDGQSAQYHVESTVVIQYCMPLPPHTGLYCGVMPTIPSLLCTAVGRHVLFLMLCII